jgi:hypothetical protein
MACRYFDPEPITVPDDPLSLEAAVTIQLQPSLAYADAVTAATDPSLWTVASTATYTVAGYPATLVQATATSDASGLPTGTSRYAYLLDLGANGTAVLGTTSATGAPPAANTSTVDLIAAESTVAAPR